MIVKLIHDEESASNINGVDINVKKPNGDVVTVEATESADAVVDSLEIAFNGPQSVQVNGLAETAEIRIFPLPAP